MKKITNLAMTLVAVMLIISAACNKVSQTSAEESTKSKEDIPYTMVDVMPEFPGGDAKLVEYIAQNAIYPEEAKQANTEGKVIVRFCVGSDGKVSQPTILKSVSEALDNEALRVVSGLPAFKPGMEDGKEVSVWYMVPITFALK